MEAFQFYFPFGWEHIISLDALDHQLFLLALIALYSWRDWKAILILVTAFTVGHSLTLVLSVWDWIRVDSKWVEFFIPLTIVITAARNLFEKSAGPQPLFKSYALALFFGLIHGLGFANTIRMMLASDQGTIFPTPNEYRTASGAPGPKYWQQRCDYDIVCELDEKNLKLKGAETVTYFNNSPDVLTYLWLQLDENEHSSVNNANYQNSSSLSRQLSVQQLQQAAEEKGDNGLGFQITKLTDALGKPLRYTINKTMMRVELPTPLKPGQRFAFKLDWNYKITDRMTIGWQNQQFTGRGEFALTFGNFKVQMTVPADHVVLSTGECQNYPLVLSPAQLSRWNKAQTTKEPIEVVTLEEAKAAEKQKSSQKKTWIYKADNVRDFAWTSSRKFIWDAMPAMVEGKKVMCMSGYPKEAYGLYRPYSTKAVAHTIKSYSESTKNGMLGVIIHEVGHNFFPMIINSDERQWSWMDEGLNTFVEYLAEELWDNKFPSRRGPAAYITDYMKLPKDQLEPIMSNSHNIVQFGPNAYSKPATGLNILRETVMGRELFDYAFKEYCRRWAFKHPEPADLFRTLEDASGEDLDWFWRGWFYSTDVCDISLDTVKYAMVDTAATQASGRASSFKRSACPREVNS